MDSDYSRCQPTRVGSVAVMSVVTCHEGVNCSIGTASYDNLSAQVCPHVFVVFTASRALNSLDGWSDPNHFVHPHRWGHPESRHQVSARKRFAAASDQTTVHADIVRYSNWHLNLDLW
jgi:hypothetical protein